MKTLSPQQLKTKIEAQEPLVLLDVRSDWEREECTIKGDTHISLGTLEQKLDQLNTDTPIVVYCHHGIRSKQAANILLTNGFTDVSHLNGGIHLWAKEIDPSMDQY